VPAIAGTASPEIASNGRQKDKRTDDQGDAILFPLLGKNARDFVGGGLMFLIGLYAIIQGSAYNVGTLTRMGPGFFPVALGVILATCGIALVMIAKLSTPAVDEKRQPREWKAWACILASIMAFIVLGHYGGLVPATFAIVFIAALGDRQNTLKGILTLSLIMVAIAIVVFWWALKLQFPLFAWN
jgi:Tripartite tricarboxylate transporter TctB family